MCACECGCVFVRVCVFHSCKHAWVSETVQVVFRNILQWKVQDHTVHKNLKPYPVRPWIFSIIAYVDLANK